MVRLEQRPQSHGNKEHQEQECEADRDADDVEADRHQDWPKEAQHLDAKREAVFKLVGAASAAATS
ncbi:hypothetical protein QA649_04830 [Bradyrhizobium sp. CB1717]|uniref:hypothetical protein n=1 Tax=Bradyrhizobium sp. CB1717 TaxID=3039154 RepID=UPI0024B139D2|nr:hypothetical protein [Bradyrhizobium sp. CB1717]WFU25550.1 hypothetical protein QA649_04830 [Bradyrhizobium sp. CB1717]